jgi:hypothetical protein
VRRSSGAIACGERARYELGVADRNAGDNRGACLGRSGHAPAEKIDKPFASHNLYMTREKMTQLRTAMRGCSRELRRIGVPSGRLQPVYALVKRACRTYDKAARCFARAVSVSDASGATFAGTPQDRIQRRSLSCGFAAQGNASNRLGDAESHAQLIVAS